MKKDVAVFLISASVGFAASYVDGISPLRFIVIALAFQVTGAMEFSIISDLLYEEKTMSEIKRYFFCADCVAMEQSNCGDYVEYDAHAAKVAEMQVEIDALKMLRDSYKRQWLGKCAEVDELNAKVFDLSMRASSLMDKLAKAEATIARLSAPISIVEQGDFLAGMCPTDEAQHKAIMADRHRAFCMFRGIDALIANRLKEPSDV